MNHKELVIFKNASEAIWVSDASQRIVFWNQKAEELLGYAAEEAVGKRCYKIVGECLAGAGPDGPTCRALCHAAEAAQGGSPVGASRMVLQEPGGGERVVNVNHTFLFPEETAKNDSYLIMHVLRETAHEENVRHELHIHLLGQTRVQPVRGAEIDGALWQRRMVRTVMAVLALHRDQGIHRDVLLDLLWPDKEREQALANLNTNVYYLRRALQPDLARGEQSRYIQIEGEVYRLNNDVAYWVDVDEFEETLALAQRTSKGSEAIAFYEKALALYQGDFLADLDLADSHFVIRVQHLHDRYLTSMKKLAALYEADGRHRRAEALYLKILGQDQLQEDACRHVMRLMLRRGDRSGVIQWFRRFEKFLASELGVGPEPETVAIYSQARGTSPLSGANGKGTGAFSFGH